jgi:trk system potassium uptake protein TrkA
MYVIVVGGGKTGVHLTNQLIHEGHEVRLIEHRTDIIEKLQEQIPPDVLLIGDGTSPTVLEAADIHRANVVAAVTGEDETNLVVTTLARFEFNTPRTIGRVNNPKNAWLFNREMGVDVSLNQTDILAKLIAEEMSLGDMMTLVKLRRGEFSIVEEKLPHNSGVLGIPLKDWSLPPTCNICAVLHKGQITIPRGNTLLEEGDEVIAIVDSASKLILNQMFAPKD